MVYCDRHLLLFTIAICTSVDPYIQYKRSSVQFESYGPTKTSPWSNIPLPLRPKAIHPSAYFLV